MPIYTGFDRARARSANESAKARQKSNHGQRTNKGVVTFGENGWKILNPLTCTATVSPIAETCNTVNTVNIDEQQ